MRAPSTRTFVRRHGVTDSVTRCVQNQSQTQSQSQSPFLLSNGPLLTCSLLEQKPQTARESFANRLKRTGLENDERGKPLRRPHRPPEDPTPPNQGDPTMTVSGTTVVTVEVTGRRATIADVRDALDIFDTEGIPATFEVDIRQWVDRDDSDTTIRYADRPQTDCFSISASRAAR